MKAIRAAIISKMSGSAFATSIGGRLYDARVKPNPTWPYAAYFFIANTPGNVFVDDMNEVIVQFSIFSDASGTTEIMDICENLIALYNNAELSAAGWRQVFMRLSGGRGVVTDYPAETSSGTGAYFQCDVDFDLTAVK